MKNFVAGLKTCLKYIIYDVKFDNDLKTIDVCISIEMSISDRCLMRCNHWNVNNNGLIWYYNGEIFKKIADIIPIIEEDEKLIDNLMNKQQNKEKPIRSNGNIC